MAADSLGVGETLGVLLDIDAESIGKLANSSLHAVAGIKIEACDDGDHQECRDPEPEPQASITGRHSLRLQAKDA
jgi:hypothetical protein